MPAKVTFDGLTKTIIVNDGITELNVKRDIYSQWKHWVLTGTNAKFLEALRSVGGDPISETKKLGSTFFLLNGWRIKPYESSHRLLIDGNLYTDPAGDSPVIPTNGNYNVVVEYSTSVLTEVNITNLSNVSKEVADEVWSKPSSEVSSSDGSMGSLLKNTSSKVSEIVPILLRSIGLMQENYYLDNCEYHEVSEGVKVLKSGRIRLYDSPLNVGTDNGIIAVYEIKSEYNEDGTLESYKVCRIS